MKKLRASYWAIVSNLRKLGFVAIGATLLGLPIREADAQTFNTLYNFTGGTSDGALPQGGLVLSGGYLFGTTLNGGSSGDTGTVFKFGYSEQLVHSFISTGHPYGGVIASGSTLYGTTGNGTVFKVDTDGSGFGTVATVGGNPSARLLISGGTRYGTEATGGAHNEGSVFKVNTDGSGLTTLHSFYANAGEGYKPICGLVLSGSTLYGTTEFWGTHHYGTVFAVDTNDGSAFTILHHFDSTDGAYPYAGLVLSGDNLFGTTSAGGAYGYGTIFAINTGDSSFTILHNFNGSDGQSPQGELLLSGNTLCGTTTSGGSTSQNNGTIFMVNTDGSGFTTLHNFTNDIDGSAPLCGMVLEDSLLFGTTSAGGTGGYGTIWALSFTPTVSVALSGPEYIYKGYTGFGVPYGGSNWFTITTSYPSPCSDFMLTFLLGGDGTAFTDSCPCYAVAGDDFTATGADSAPFPNGFYVTIPPGETEVIIGVQTLDTSSDCEGNQTLLFTIPGDPYTFYSPGFYVDPYSAQATAYIVPD